MKAIFESEVIDVEVLDTERNHLGTKYTVSGKFSNGLSIILVTDYKSGVTVVGSYPNGRLRAHEVRIMDI